MRQITPGDGSPPTLTDPRGLGGIVALCGFDYQLFDGLIRLPGWLANPVFEQMMYEGLEDLEARFFSPYAAQLHALDRFQAKSANLLPSQVRRVLESFRAFEDAYPNTARVQTLVTSRLPGDLGWLRRNPSRVRQARPFYAPFPDIVAASDKALKAQCINSFGEALGPFVADFVEIDERDVLDKDAAVFSFSRELYRFFPTLRPHPRKLEATFGALASLARSRHGVPLARSELEEVLQQTLQQELPLSSAFPLYVLSNRDEPNPAALQIDARAFSGDPAPYPPPEIWASDLIRPLDRTAHWLRNRSVSRVALSGSYRLTTALVVGWSLRSAPAFELDVPTREGTWRTDDRPRTGESAPEWQIEVPRGFAFDRAKKILENIIVFNDLFGCGGSQPPRPTFSDCLDLTRNNFLILWKILRSSAVLFAVTRQTSCSGRAKRNFSRRDGRSRLPQQRAVNLAPFGGNAP